MEFMRETGQLSLFPEEITDSQDGEWDFTGTNTQYLTHALHPYLASMIPPVVSKLLAMYADSDTRILDPFVGGGTVLVESYLRDLASTGSDINPLAILISKAKTTPIPTDILMRALEAFEDIYLTAAPIMPSIPDSARIDFWFKSYMLEPLSRIRTAIDMVVNRVGGGHQEQLKNLYACVFSDTVRDVSLTYRGEVRLRRLQGTDLERFNPDVVTEFRKRMRYAFSKVSLLPADHKIPVVYEGNVLDIPSQDKAFDLVLTSPPYGDIKNTIPYHQFSKNMIYWLGLGEPAVDQIKQGALGSKNGRKDLPPSTTLQQAVGQMQKPNLIHEAVCFYSDYLLALTEIARVTSQRIIIIIGHRILDGVIIDNPGITTDMMQEIGWRLEDRFNRRIKKKRLNRKMGFGNNAQGATIDSEAILVYVPSNSRRA
jgi:site-specific DNA-methyltransferase (cytosine-N4-specific)